MPGYVGRNDGLCRLGSLAVALCLLGFSGIGGCAGGGGSSGSSSSGTPPPSGQQLTTTITSPANPNVNVQADIGTQNFTATVTNDSQNGGVAWTLTLNGSACGGNTCGTLSNSTSASGVAITYTAPAAPPASSVTLTAASATDKSKTASGTINITPAVSVAMSSPTSANVNVQADLGSQQFSVTVSNDAQNAGVNWTLGGTGCTTSACGALSSTTSVSGTPITYTAPSNAPSPATVTLTATSVTDGKQRASWAITVMPRVSIAISSPANPNVNVQADVGTQSFTATVANDLQNAGVTWTLAGAGCNGAACGTLSSSASASGAPITYKAAKTPPIPATVTLTATSVTAKNQTAPATITITPAVAVSASASRPSVAVKLTAQLTATVSNDAQNRGVNWTMTIGGAACTPACGILSSTFSLSGAPITYTAPASVPNPATVTLTATSITDSAQSNAAAITITLPISVIITPPYVGANPPVPVYYPTSASNSYPLQINQSEDFTATVQNDVNSQGVTWSVSSSPVCSSGACGTFNSTTASTTYTAPGPGSVPVGSSPVTFTVTGTSAADPTKSFSVTVPVSNGIPTAAGWFEIPKTLLRPTCLNISQILGADGCQAVFSAWNGGVADTARDRLLFTGGGHQNYWGNEVYSLDLNASSASYLTLTRLNSPVFPTPIPSCTEDWGPPSAPAAREGYGGLAYVSGADDKMWLFGGALGTSGCRSGGMWLLDLPTLTWARQDRTVGITPPGSIVLATPSTTTPTDINYSDYDAASGLVYTYVADADILASYSPATNTLTTLVPPGSFSGQTNYRANAVLDPKRHIFLIVGQGTFGWFDLNTLNANPPTAPPFIDVGVNMSTTDCGAFVDPINNNSLENVHSPGLAYDPDVDRVVGWAGGSTMYVIDTRQATTNQTLACKAMTTFTGGPPQAALVPSQPSPTGAQYNGTFGRFRYFPALKLFALLNDWEQDAFTFRLPNPLPNGF